MGVQLFVLSSECARRWLSSLVLVHRTEYPVSKGVLNIFTMHFETQIARIGPAVTQVYCKGRALSITYHTMKRAGTVTMHCRNEQISKHYYPCHPYTFRGRNDINMSHSTGKKHPTVFAGYVKS